MHTVTVNTIPGVARRFRAGRGFGPAPQQVSVDAATLAALQADPLLVVQQPPADAEQQPPGTREEAPATKPPQKAEKAPRAAKTTAGE